MGAGMTGYELLIGLEMLVTFATVLAQLPSGRVHYGSGTLLVWGLVDMGVIAMLIANLDSWQHTVLIAIYTAGALLCLYRAGEGGKTHWFRTQLDRSVGGVMALLLFVGYMALLITG